MAKMAKRHCPAWMLNMEHTSHDSTSGVSTYMPSQKTAMNTITIQRSYHQSPAWRQSKDVV